MCLNPSLRARVQLPLAAHVLPFAPSLRVRAVACAHSARAPPCGWGSDREYDRSCARVCDGDLSHPTKRSSAHDNSCTSSFSLPCAQVGRGEYGYYYITTSAHASARCDSRSCVRARRRSFFLLVGIVGIPGVVWRHTRKDNSSLSCPARQAPLLGRWVPDTRQPAIPFSRPPLRAFWHLFVGVRSSGTSHEPKGSVRTGACTPARCVRVPTPSREDQPASKSPRYIPRSMARAF